MKKGVKAALIVLGILVGIILLDTIQALVFNNSPIIGIQTKCMEKKGILVNTYYCNDGKNITRLKFSNYPLESSCYIKSVCDKVEKSDNSNEQPEMSLKDAKERIDDYFGNVNNDRSNLAYNYIDEEKNIIVVGLVDASKEKQEEFIDNVFSKCCGSKYIQYVKENNLIDFKESKAIITGKIIEAKDDSITVEVIEDSNSSKKGDKYTMKISRPTNGTNDFYVVGNIVRVTFNGNVETSNPAQIGALKIELITE